MRAPMTLAELAKLAHIDRAEVERYRELGLLDPDGDGLCDELDVLRLRILMHYRGLGYDPDELTEAALTGSRAILYSDLLFAPDQEGLSFEQVSERTGLPVDDVQAIRRAVGLTGPIPAPDVVFYEAVAGLVDSGVPLDVILDLGRVYGDTLRRLAQSEVKMIRSFVAAQSPSSLLKDRAQSERLQSVQDLIGPILEPLLLNVHRQHLLRASVQEALADLEAEAKGEDREARDATIVFVDLAQFTPLAQVHGDEVAADVLDRFDGLVRRLLESHEHGSLVKQIGDAFMLTFTSAADAIRFTMELDDAAAEESYFPALRAGLHTGTVLYRVGDYVGNTVNIAARIAARAKANEILVTEPVSKAATDAGIGVIVVGEEELPGVDESIKLWKVVRPRLRRQARDPVCGMTVDADAVARLRHLGVEYAFCSPACLSRFLDDPTKYVGDDREAKPEL